MKAMANGNCVLDEVTIHAWRWIGDRWHDILEAGTEGEDDDMRAEESGDDDNDPHGRNAD